MKYEYIYTVRKATTQHIIDLTDAAMQLIEYSTINIYGIPEEWEENKKEQALDEFDKAVFLGEITGFLIMGAEIYRRGEDMYDLCDEVFGDLEFVVSALMESNGPLSGKHNGDAKNHYYIDKIEIKDKNVLSELIENLPDIIFSHHNIHTEIISYLPSALPHEMSKLDKVKRDIAMMAYSDTLNRLIDGEDDEPEKPHLVMSKEQLNIMMGKRNDGVSYPAEYIDHEAWQPFLDSGFEEWRNTRVLYKEIEK